MLGELLGKLLALGQLEDQARRGRVTPRFGRSTAFYLPRAGDRKRQDAANIRVPRNSAALTPIVLKSRPNSQRKQPAILLGMHVRGNATKAAMKAALCLLGV